MNSDLFKGAVENARAVHRALLLASLVLSAFLMPVLISHKGSLQKAIETAASMRKEFVERGYNEPLVNGTVQFLLDSADNGQAAKTVIENPLENAFEYDGGNDRKIINIIYLPNFDTVDPDFVFDDTKKQMLSLALYNSPNRAEALNQIVTQRMRFLNQLSPLPPSGRFGTLTPRWMDNITAIMPDKLDTLSDAIRFWYVLTKIEAITFLIPEFDNAKLSIEDLAESRFINLSEIDDLKNAAPNLGLRCDNVTNGVICRFEFSGYEVVNGDGDVSQSAYEIRSAVTTKKYNVEAHIPASPVGVEFNARNKSKLVSNSGDECNAAEMRSAIDFVNRYGDVPLDSIVAIFNAVTNSGQSLQIFGIGITGILWISILGSWLIVAVFIALLVNLRAVEVGSRNNDLKVYAEIVPITEVGYILAVLSVAGLPNLALIESVLGVWDEAIAVKALALAALAIGMFCSYRASIAISRLRRTFNSDRDQRVGASEIQPSVVELTSNTE